MRLFRMRESLKLFGQIVNSVYFQVGFNQFFSHKIFHQRDLCPHFSPPPKKNTASPYPLLYVCLLLFNRSKQCGNLFGNFFSFTIKTLQAQFYFMFISFIYVCCIMYILPAKWIRQADTFRLAQILPAEWKQG